MQTIEYQKQAEALLQRNYKLLRIASETSHFGGWSVNLDDNIVIWSDTVAQIHDTPAGYCPSLQEGIMFYAPEWRNKIEKAFNDCAQQGIPYSEEMEIISAKGVRKWIRTTGAPEKDNDGRIFLVQGSFQDISDQKRTEAKLKEKEQELNNLLASKDKLLSIIAHDLRSPFNSILGFSDLLKDDQVCNDQDKVKSYASMLNSVALQTFQLLENLLDWARMQQGKMVFLPREISLKEVTIDVLEIVEECAKQKQINVTVQIGEEVRAKADENMIKTVLRNLISNAIKFNHPGGVVKISAGMGDGATLVKIEDNGIGISEENQKKLFDFTVNFTMPGTKREKGSGLGLILCKDFVEMHKGNISIESKEGSGSTVSFSLPLQ